MTATATLWSSETLVSTAVIFYKIIVTNKLMHYGFSGFFDMPFFNKTVLVRKTFHRIQITFSIQIIYNH